MTIPTPTPPNPRPPRPTRQPCCSHLLAMQFWRAAAAPVARPSVHYLFDFPARTLPAMPCRPAARGCAHPCTLSLLCSPHSRHLHATHGPRPAPGLQTPVLYSTTDRPLLTLWPRQALWPWQVEAGAAGSEGAPAAKRGNGFAARSAPAPQHAAPDRSPHVSSQVFRHATLRAPDAHSHSRSAFRSARFTQQGAAGRPH